MKRSGSIRWIAYTAVGVALIAVCSWISVPSLLPTMVPFTMQTFAVCLISALLGARLGCWAVGCYILLGAVGVPVFSGVRGGAAVLLGTTGGYIVGFLLTALIVGLTADKLGREAWKLAPGMIAGVLACYVFGTAWFLLVYTRTKGALSVLTAVGWCVTPYLIPDAIKIALAVFLSGRLYPIVSREGRTA